VFETPTDERYAVVNEGKGEGDRVLTKTEYDEYVAPAEVTNEEVIDELTTRGLAATKENQKQVRFELEQEKKEVAPVEEAVAPSEQITQKRQEDRDQVVPELQKAREELGIYVDDQLFEGISEDTENAVDKLDNGEQLTWAQAEKASKELYDKYKEIAAMKNDPNRMHTTEQIDNMLDFLGQEINNLETYIQNEQANIEGETGIESVAETETTEEVTTQEKITDDAIQEPSTEGRRSGYCRRG
jgi:hypothetical protein